MLISYWIVAGLLALANFAAGVMKLAQPRPKLVAAGMAWAGDFPSSAIKTIGAVEVVGALGLVLPLATGIAPVLSPLAAVGLALVRISAVFVHARRGENKMIAINVVLAALGFAAAVLGFGVLS